MHQKSSECPQNDQNLDEKLLFALTANDPMGLRVSSEDNRKANASLWQELQEFKRNTEGYGHNQIFVFPGAGFLDDGTDWEKERFYFEYNSMKTQSYERKIIDFLESNFPFPEQGFLVFIICCETVTNDDKRVAGHFHAKMNDFRTHIIELARKYQQGAIYEFRKKGENGITRSTVPVCIQDCESEVELKVCSLRIYDKQTLQK